MEILDSAHHHLHILQADLLLARRIASNLLPNGSKQQLLLFLALSSNESEVQEQLGHLRARDHSSSNFFLTRSGEAECFGRLDEVHLKSVEHHFVTVGADVGRVLLDIKLLGHHLLDGLLLILPSVGILNERVESSLHVLGLL